MDFNALQHKLFAMDPVDPREDLAKLKGQAGNMQESAEFAKDYVQESVAVPEGSLQMDRNYSVNDFAALAGVALTEKKQRDADQVRGSEPMPAAEPGRKKHPYQDRLVGDSIDNDVAEGSQEGRTIGALLAKVQELDARIARLEADNARLRRQESVEYTTEESNLKSRQKTQETIKGELYQRLNKLLSE